MASATTSSPIQFLTAARNAFETACTTLLAEYQPSGIIRAIISERAAVHTLYGLATSESMPSTIKSYLGSNDLPSEVRLIAVHAIATIQNMDTLTANCRLVTTRSYRPSSTAEAAEDMARIFQLRTGVIDSLTKFSKLLAHTTFDFEKTHRRFEARRLALSKRRA